MTRKQAKAKRYVRENATLIILHSLYQRWGLPTALLKPAKPAAGPR
jgi:hypothetical protein